jgi:hypothetical protein
MLQIVTKPTRYSGNSATIINHVITNFQSNSYDTVILTSQLSDHFPVVYLREDPIATDSPKFIECRNFSQDNNLAFGTVLSGTSWGHILECNDTQIAYNLFHDTFFNLYELFFPSQTC